MPSINSARYAQRIIQTESHESPSFLRKVHRLDPPALYIRDCESLCLSDETVKAVGPFYLVPMPGEVKRSHTGGKCVTCRGLHMLFGVY